MTLEKVRAPQREGARKSQEVRRLLYARVRELYGAKCKERPELKVPNPSTEEAELKVGEAMRVDVLPLTEN
jgi:hypothetical protein